MEVIIDFLQSLKPNANKKNSSQKLYVFHNFVLEIKFVSILKKICVIFVVSLLRLYHSVFFTPFTYERFKKAEGQKFGSGRCLTQLGWRRGAGTAMICTIMEPWRGVPQPAMPARSLNSKGRSLASYYCTVTIPAAGK